MKVVFIEDVPDVALAGETKVVADGYGRNYLLPKKLAVLANSAASNILEAQMKKVAVKRAQAAAEMTELSGKLDGMEIAITAKVGEKEKLYGSITSADIAGELAKSGIEIDKRKIELEEPIKELGSYDITIRFTHDITAAIKVNVEGEAVVEEKPEKAERKPRARKAEEAEAAEAGTEGPVAETAEAGAEPEEPEAAVTGAEVGAEAAEPEAQVKAEADAAAEAIEIAAEEAEAEADKEKK